MLKFTLVYFGAHSIAYLNIGNKHTKETRIFM